MDLFSNLKSFFKTDATNIDNYVFRLHYKFTCVVLVAFSILVTGRQYIGDPIDCINDDGVPSKLLDTWCWIHTTFSVNSAWKKDVGKDVPYPGVDKYVEDSGEPRTFHAYYQWVCFVLFLQAILFYVPRYFWKCIEGGRIKNLALGLNCPVIPEETRKNNKNLIVDYFVSNVNNHNYYYYSFALAEIMNFVNVIGQMFLMNTLLGGAFMKYGKKVLSFSEWDYSVRYDPMIEVFPRLTKCTFYLFGSSGSLKKYDAMCILPINIINEKLYVFLWFWFVILAAFSAVTLVYRLATLLLPSVRLFMTKFRARIANTSSLETVINRCQVGDWLVLDLLCKNIDSLNFRDIVDELAVRLDKGVVNV